MFKRAFASIQVVCNVGEANFAADGVEFNEARKRDRNCPYLVSDFCG